MLPQILFKSLMPARFFSSLLPSYLVQFHLIWVPHPGGNDATRMIYWHNHNVIAPGEQQEKRGEPGNTQWETLLESPANSNC